MSGRLLALLLALCLASAALPVAAQEAEDQGADVEPTGLTGHVVLALRCPVPLGGDDTMCPDRPWPSTLSLRSADGSTELGEYTTDDAGAFWILLDPGMYEVVVSTREIPVTVGPTGMTELMIRVPVSPRN